ncbi:hypothetical protein SCHPADRAFT_901278 [Schizopora paradoxa]|uniref:Uncharacterized protein n=1 Tax=Schizopora paradoxa TaxID=27342 RepID=A0A0H2SI52_9AGAM|nr:hypothetical protein SCHPADRAFT_901278 [Schizopora paradoxa]
MPSATQAQKFTLLSDHAFTPAGDPMHEATLEKLQKLLEKASNRDPDAFGMYIYNDFFGYALLDLVDKTLSTIHTTVQKKKWVESWQGLVALSEFFERCGEWTQVDDGERVEVTDNCYGAMLVTTIKGLDAQGNLNEETFQDLETSLRCMAGWSDCMHGLTGSKYNKVIKGFGKKIFGKRTTEERAVRNEQIRNAYAAFYGTLSEQDIKKKGYLKPRSAESMKKNGKDADEDEDDEDEEDEEDNDGDWFAKGKVSDIETESKAYKVPPVWKEYKAQLAGAPREPLRGPREWDLNKWSAAAKKQFSFDNLSDDGEDDFF